MPTVLVTGANRGLGLEFVRQYLAQGWEVYACTRKPEAPELRATDQANLHIHQLEVTDHPTVDALSEQLANVTIDVLVNNAGTTGPKGAPECMEYSGVDNMDYQIWRDTMEVNLLGAFKIATAFKSNLARAERGILVNMSSDLGSMEQNTMGSMYSYRTSKTALNMMSKGFAVEWPEIISISMAPGWCKTELGGEGAPIDPADSVADQIKTLSTLDAEKSGCFIDRFGELVAY